MGSQHSKILGVFSLLISLNALMALNMALPFPAWAEPRQEGFVLSAQGSQNFEALMRQAESIALEFIEQSFAESPSVTEVSVMVVGEHNGQEVPLLSSRVSRSSWQAEPRLHAWTQYFGSAEILLGFIKPQQPVATASAQPVPAFDPVGASMTDREPNFYE
jgi:hypothetical protein